MRGIRVIIDRHLHPLCVQNPPLELEGLQWGKGDQHVLTDLVHTLHGPSADVHWPGVQQSLRQSVHAVSQSIIHCLSDCAGMSMNEVSTNEVRDTSRALFNGFIDAFEGEKDPRVLNRCLTLAPEFYALLNKFHSTSQQAWLLDDDRKPADAIVSILSMYFPITFKPPPNDFWFEYPEISILGISLTLRYSNTAEAARLARVGYALRAGNRNRLYRKKKLSLFKEGFRLVINSCSGLSIRTSLGWDLTALERTRNFNSAHPNATFKPK